jgi:hypothetical protein
MEVIMSVLSLYVILKVGVVRGALFGVGFFVWVLTIIMFVAFAASSVKKGAALYKKKAWFFLCAFAGFILIVVGSFVPTSKEMAALYVIPKLANSQGVQEIPSKILKLTDEWLEELRPGKVLGGEGEEE